MAHSIFGPRGRGCGSRITLRVKRACARCRGRIWHDGAVSFFLVFLAIALVGAVLWTGLGRRPNTGSAGRPTERPLPALLDGGLAQPPANLPPVLLPAEATAEDVDRIRFSLGLRGYRMDQVDQVLDELRDQLSAKDAEIDELRSRLPAQQDSV